jgi:hypothetical protein
MIATITPLPAIAHSKALKRSGVSSTCHTTHPIITHATHCHHVHHPNHGFTDHSNEASAHNKNAQMKNANGCGNRTTRPRQNAKPTNTNAPTWIKARFGTLKLS